MTKKASERVLSFDFKGKRQDLTPLSSLLSGRKKVCPLIGALIGFLNLCPKFYFSLAALLDFFDILPA